MGLFEKIKAGLKKTIEGMAFAFSSDKPDDDFYDEIEEKLILSDAGMDTTEYILDELKERIKKNHITESDEAIGQLKEICTELLRADSEPDYSGKPAVILLIGVNGAGKTTTAGKLANLFTRDGKKVTLAAADTFRAAAEQQLEVWGERSGVEVIKGANDPSAVIYDAVSSANARGSDIVICDTAGRLHNKKNLMDELAKMSRTVKKAAPSASVETYLVIDAVTGQNALNQAASFAVGAGVSGIILTKLDGTAKGGSVIAIKKKLGIPVRFIGVGEQIDDLIEFRAEDFANALFGD